MGHLVCEKCEAIYWKPKGQQGAPHNCGSYTGRKERSLVSCSWPECRESVRCLVLQPTKLQGYTRYRMSVGRMASSVRYPICEFHQKRIIEMLGVGYRLNGIKAIVNGQDIIASRRVSAPLTRLVVYDKTRGKCEECSVELEFAGKWHADHITPIFKGGVTSFSNLRAVCTNCHTKKTSLEKSEANKTRYGVDTSHGWHNRRQLIELLAKKDKEIARLKTIIAGYASEEEMAG